MTHGNEQSKRRRLRGLAVSQGAGADAVGRSTNKARPLVGGRVSGIDRVVQQM
jgi:hypothetical protein